MIKFKLGEYHSLHNDLVADLAPFLDRPTTLEDVEHMCRIAAAQRRCLMLDVEVKEDEVFVYLLNPENY